MALFRRDNHADEPEVSDPGADIDLEELDDTKVSGSAKWLVTALDRAANLQAPAIESYVDRLKRSNPDASAQELQEKLDTHFRNVVTGTGAGSGGASAVPFLGFVTGALTIGAESLVFVDLVVFYTLASAYLRGLDIRSPRTRRTLVLVSLLGSQGSVLIDVLLPQGLATTGLPALNRLSKLSGPTLNELNSRLMRVALKTINKRIRRAWLSKLLPMGVGAVVGSVANRKLAAHVIERTNQALGSASSGQEASRNGTAAAQDRALDKAAETTAKDSAARR